MAEMRWVVAAVDGAQVARIRGAVGAPEAVARVLAGRGVQDAGRFLEPGYGDLLEPRLMLGMDRAVARIQAAVATGEAILIYGDYDVDGTVATVLLKTAIERVAPPGVPAKVSFHVPHRLKEGYGMQTGRLAEAAAAGIRLVISVDTGIRAFAQAVEAKALGMDLIVTDHHLPDGAEGVPEAVAVVNPAQAGCGYPNKELCGAGVAFKVAQALLEAHAVTAEQQRRLREVLVPSFLKLVAIATVADSVALTGENRAMVWLGLRELRNPVQPGLRALMEVAKLALDKAPTASEVGFRIAPRINAAGRMDIASDVVELFLTRDAARAWELAVKLDELNQARRDEEAAALDAIELQLMTLKDAAGEYAPECIVLDHPEWHRGVLGILASRVVDRTGRPAIVMRSEAPEAHGSGRSIDGYHLLDALTYAHGAEDAEPLFARFGGHAHAVGFSLESGRMAALRERMRAHSRGRLTTEMLRPQVFCDAEVPADELTMELLRWLERCAPFGIGNPEPVLVTRGLEVCGAPRVIKEKHVCVPLRGAKGATINAMGWSRPGRMDWAERVTGMGLMTGSSVDIVYRLRENLHPTYGGLELEMVDVAMSEVQTGTNAQDAMTKFA